MINNNIVAVKFIDPDGDFLVLEIMDDSKNSTEVFIDKQAFRFTSERTQSAILNKLIENVSFLRNETENSFAKLAISVKQDKEWNRNITKDSEATNKDTLKLSSAFIKELGLMSAGSDQEKLKDFLGRINVRVNEG